MSTTCVVPDGSMLARNDTRTSPALRTRRLTDPVSAESIAAVRSIGIHAVNGDPTRMVSDAMPIGRATALDLTFCSRDGVGGATLMASSHAGVIICSPAAASELRSLASIGPTLLITDAPRLAFARTLAQFFEVPPALSRHATAFVHPSATVADDVVVGPYVVIGENCEVGSGSVLHAHVCLEAGTRLGARVIVHAGAVIGVDGFGHERTADGTLQKFPQIGGVWIGDDVEIGAKTCICRGALTDTIVESGARIDNLVHIAHNVVIGRDAVIIANAMIAGSTRIGARAWVAPSAAILDGLVVGDDAVIGLGAVVIRNVDEHAVVVGNPAKPLVARTAAAT